MPKLGPIACVTIASPDLERSLQLYREFLGYECVAKGEISAELSRLWSLPKLSGRRYALTLPEGQGSTYIRFVQSPPDAAYQAFRHMGWNAAEIMVQDTDAVAKRLEGSPFKVIGPPADLSFSDKIRAMQVLGPSNEALYLTAFKEKLPIFDTPDANHFVDRTFIVIVGGPSVAQLSTFYARHLGVAHEPILPAVVSVLSRAHGLPPDTLHDIAALKLSGQSFIEADTMPAGTLPRESKNGELPAAISMISFGIDSLADTGLTFLSTPVQLEAAPYRGRRVALCAGAGGELIELIEG